MEDAEDGDVVDGCLILKKEEYVGESFRDRGDFRAVLALRLRVVPSGMFSGAASLEAVAMLEAEEIEDGKAQDDSLLEDGEQSGDTNSAAQEEEGSDEDQ